MLADSHAILCVGQMPKLSCRLVTFILLVDFFQKTEKNVQT